jgi:hypothetical protein
MSDLTERIEALEKWRELYRAWKETEWVDESDAMAYADVLADAGDELATALEQAQARIAHTIEVLNDCQAELGRQCARADMAQTIGRVRLNLANQRFAVQCGFTRSAVKSRDAAYSARDGLALALAINHWHLDYQAGVTRLMAACLAGELGRRCATCGQLDNCYIGNKAARLDGFRRATYRCADWMPVPQPGNTDEAGDR